MATSPILASFLDTVSNTCWSYLFFASTSLLSLPSSSQRFPPLNRLVFNQLVLSLSRGHVKSAWPDNRRGPASPTQTRDCNCSPTEEQKKPNQSLKPRDFDTRVHTKSATRSEKCSFTSFPLALVLRNRSPTHCPWVSTTLQPRTPVRPLQTRFPAPRVEPLRVSSTKLRLAPYALLLTPPSQIPAHHHLIHRIVTLKTGKMPREDGV